MTKQKFDRKEKLEVWKTLMIFGAIAYPLATLILLFLWISQFKVLFWVVLGVGVVDYLVYLIILTRLSSKLGVFKW